MGVIFLPVAVGSDYPLLTLPFIALLGSILAFLLLRLGLLAGIAALTFIAYFSMVTTTDFSSWSSGPTWMALGGCLGWTLYGFIVSLGGRPMFGSGLLGEEN